MVKLWEVAVTGDELDMESHARATVARLSPEAFTHEERDAAQKPSSTLTVPRASGISPKLEDLQLFILARLPLQGRAIPTHALRAGERTQPRIV